MGYNSLPVSTAAGAPVAQGGSQYRGLQSLLEVRGLGVSFRSASGKSVQAVESVDFSLEREQILALVGESGSGKSVTALAVMGLLPERSARLHPGSQILFDGVPMRGPDAPGGGVLAKGQDGVRTRSLRGRHIAMIFQDPLTSLNPVYSVGFQIAEMMRVHLGASRAQAMQRAQHLLQEVGIPEPHRRVHAYPHELSGGQQQRVMIAMALACEPALLIADEPTTALDVTIQRQILLLLLELKRRRRMAILFITHDLGLVGEFADTVVVMRHGKVREAGAVGDVFSAPADPYTRALLLCRPDAQKPVERLLTIEDWSNVAQDPPGIAIVAPPSSHPPQPSTPSHPSPSSPASPAAPPSPPADRRAILEVRGLRKVFKRRAGLFRRDELLAVDGLSFCLARGRTVGIVGESGSGKTTAGLCILGLHQASAGEVLFDGQDLLRMDASSLFPIRRRLQIVFQNPYASLNPRFTVGDILVEPMLLHRIGRDASGRLVKVRALLDRVGLPSAAINRYPHEFSGGQRQRIAIARCLALEPEVMVCDEAVSALDVSVQAQVLNLLKDLQRDLGLSYVFISHDLAVVRHMADQLLVMQAGKVVEQGDAARIYQAPAHSYTRALLEAIPRGYPMAHADA